MIVENLVEFYVDLRDAWRGALLERNCAPDSPRRRWQALPEHVPITGRDMLMQYAENSAMLTAQAVTQHLGLLARACWLEPSNPQGPERRQWLHGAPFAPARAVIEGHLHGRVGLLIDPTVDPDDRVIRGAMLGLWSHQRTWEKDITDAGLSIGQAAACRWCLPVRTPGRCGTAP